MGLVEDFAELFEGRRDAFGIADGGCLRSQSPWLAFVDDHLVGRRPIGAYPMVWQPTNDVGDGMVEGLVGWGVKWGCVDFDIKSEAHKLWDYEHEDEAHIAAVNLQKTLRHLGAVAWIERTRSAGRHVWVFADGWCSAATMRRALLVACSVAGVSAREVNPKQETLTEGQLGNYVRLPYPGWGDGHRFNVQHMVSEWGTPFSVIPLQTFVTCALAERTSPDVLEGIAAKWREPEPQRSKPTYLDEMLAYDGSLDGLLKDLNDYGHHVFVDGPTEAEDRSSALMRLARACERSGLTPTSTYKLLENADERWGKFSGRSDREKRLKDVINKVYTT